MRTVKVLDDASKALGQLVGRESMIAVLVWLHGELGSSYQEHRKRRLPDDPHDFFWVPLKIREGVKWHRLRIIVDDARATDHLLVVNIDRQP